MRVRNTLFVNRKFWSRFRDLRFVELNPLSAWEMYGV